MKKIFVLFISLFLVSSIVFAAQGSINGSGTGQDTELEDGSQVQGTG